jgi:hypothetical protein
MFGKIGAWFRKCWSTLTGKAAYLALLSVALVDGLCGSVFAQTGANVEIATTNINWSGIPQQIMTVLASPIVVGIGIALSIWVVFSALQFFRRSARS